MNQPDDICPNCGREWPARFGAHNCNMHRAYVHNKALVFEPGANLEDCIENLAYRFYGETCKSAEYADLGGDPSPYPDALGQVDAAIGRLKTLRKNLQELAHHSHEWNDSDYCNICGADGRA